MGSEMCIRDSILSVQNNGEILILKKSNFLIGAFLLASSIFFVKVKAQTKDTTLRILILLLTFHIRYDENIIMKDT